MKPLKLVLLGTALAAFLPDAHANTPPPVDCGCVSSLPALVTNGCPAFVPDIRSLATNCYSTNVVFNDPNAVTQVPPPGFPASSGTNTIYLTVIDNQTNTLQCEVEFVVVQPPNPTLSLLCNSNKTVECGSAWSFDEPVIVSTCCDPFMTINILSTTTNGICPLTIQRTWEVTNSCGSIATCDQMVTVVDTQPPQDLCAGINLVPNPGFEFAGYCPSFFSQLSAAVPWFNPTVATPDYFNPCASFSLVSAPTNWAGVQTAYSGQSYGGFFAYSETGLGTNDSYREYLAAPLLAPLATGQTYQVSFRVSLSETSAWAIANIGAHFSTGPLLGSGQGVLDVTPQVANPGSDPLASTSDWMLIQGTFTAVGGEDHVTIGNFLSDPATAAAPASGTYTNFAYYYLDEVIVEPLCEPVPTNKILQCGVPWNFDQPIGFDQCSGYDVAVTIASTTTNGTCPQVFTRTWTLTDACGNSTNLSQSVTVFDTLPPDPFCIAPNLVPNGRFESYWYCPTGLSQLNLAAPWYPATQGSPDAYNSCAAATLVWVPTNVFGDQLAYEGQGYAGAYMYSLTEGTNLVTAYREYLQVALIEPLVASQAYPVSFQVCLAELSGQAIAEIGAHFSVGPVTNYANFDGVLSLNPHVINPSTNLLTSTNTWVVVQGSYTAAGGETHLTIGNFYSDAATTAVPADGWFTSYAYYYIDDVRVGTPCSVMPPEKVVPCGQPAMFDTITGYDDCSGTNFTTVITTVTNNPCPLVATRTWTLTDLCGNSTNVSQTLFVVDYEPPVVNCDCLLDTTLELLSTNACSGIIPDLALLTNSACLSDNCGPLTLLQSPIAGTVVGPGSHPLSLTFSDCGGNSTNCTLYYQVSSPVVTLSGPPNLYVLTCSNSLPVNYSVTAVNNVGPVVCTPPSGSLFPLGTNLVTCIATNPCGGIVTYNFNVVVRPGTLLRWGCLQMVIGIPFEILNLGGGGGSSSAARMVVLPDLPDGGHGALFENFATNQPETVRFDFGAAQEFTFTTELDFTAPRGGRFDLMSPPASGEINPTPLLSFLRSTNINDGWEILRTTPAMEPPTNLYRSIALGTNGELFSSFTQDAATLSTNVIATIAPMNGVTNAVMTVTVDCQTHAVTLTFPHCEWIPNATRKGWDGCIYGPDRPVKQRTNTVARLVFTPLNPSPPTPFANVDLVVSNLVRWPIYNPTLTSKHKKWGDGHVTIMKAYDDGSEEGLDFVMLGEAGGVSTDLGHASALSFRIDRFETGGIPTQNEIYRVTGWPPGTTTNGPTPPTNFLRLTQGVDGGGLPAVDCAADFTQWGVSNVTVQLWDSGALVGQTNLPATLATPLVTLAEPPTFFACPAVGIISLGHTNPIAVLSGLDCPSGVCEGNELRILAEIDPGSTPPLAFTGLECLLSQGMDHRISNLETTPACVPESMQVIRGASDIQITWEGAGFRLQGAENVIGPWYDLGVISPAVLPANSSLRVFRLICD